MSEPDYDFLNEEAPDEVVPETTDTPEPIAETVDAATPETPAPVVTTTPEPAEERVPLAAVMAERHKRQEAERRLAEYERNQQQQQPQPSFYEAPEQYVQQIEMQATQRLHAALEAQARESYTDYDAVMDELNAYAQQNPACVPQIMGSANPALAAYKFGKQLRELKEMQDPAAYRQKLETEIRTKLEAEYAARDEAKRKAAEAVPPDLSAVRSSRDSEVIADDSLDSILSSRKK